MTRSSEPAERPPLLTVPRAQFEAELNDRIRLGSDLLGRKIAIPSELEAAESDYYTWDEYNRELLKRRFTGSEIADRYSSWAGAFVAGDPTFAEKVEEYREDVRSKLRHLDSLKQQVPLFEESPQAGAMHESQPTAERRPGAIESISIVHGHDEALKLAVHGFLREIADVEPIILHNEPNRGRTVLEKFEAVGSAAGFAIVLLTADDVGGTAAEPTDLKSRARQNVVWEFGFFAGALGRSHVAVIYEEGVELPSDLHGLAYIRYDDAGAWKLPLAKELKDAGVAVDANKLI